MKKTILVALIAATALVPIGASAQDWQGRGNRERGERQERQPNDGARPERPAFDRDAAREQRQAARAAQPQAAPAPVQPMQRQPMQRPTLDRAQQRAERPAQAPTFQQRQDPRSGRFGQERRDFRADRNAVRQDYRRDRNDQRSDVQRPDARRDWSRNNDRSWNRGNDRNLNRGNDRNWNRGNDSYRGNWNRGWRNDRRYDWSGWRAHNRNQYRLPRYYAPRGYNYGYQRFGIGVTLGSILFSQNYWINDPGEYRLPPAYEPYRWVRYYNDALLVDIYSGEVVDVIYDIFW